jgi:hypothetical protein
MPVRLCNIYCITVSRSDYGFVGLSYDIVGLKDAFDR